MRGYRRLLLVLTALPLLAGCVDVVVWLTKEDTPWSYIRDRCFGPKLGPIDTSGSRVAIPIELSSLYDSGVCFYSASGRLSHNRVEIIVRRGLCSGGPIPPLVVRLAKPGPGDYQIVYGDAGADYPVIGSLHVD